MIGEARTSRGTSAAHQLLPGTGMKARHRCTIQRRAMPPMNNHPTLRMAHPSTVARTTGKVLAWIIVIVLVLCAAIAVFVVTFDWNRARP